MSHLALTLILISAFAHATWNLIAKRVAGGLAFQWLFTILSVALYLPVAAVLVLAGQAHVSGLALLFIGVTALLQLAYFAVLQRGYRVGDLSLVYPLARGSGPLLATALAVVLRGERPGPVALGGALLIATGTFFLTGTPRALLRSGSGKAVVYALLTGVTIAAYTLWDKDAVTNIGISPIVYYWGAMVVQGALLAPVVLRSAAWRKEVGEAWRRHRRAVFGVAFLSPLAYFLVLTALATTPVYYVASTREIGILIATVMGWRLLAEGHTRRRLVAAAMMVGGVALLAVG